MTVVRHIGPTPTVESSRVAAAAEHTAQLTTASQDNQSKLQRHIHPRQNSEHRIKRRRRTTTRTRLRRMNYEPIREERPSDLEEGASPAGEYAAQHEQHGEGDDGAAGDAGAGGAADDAEAPAKPAKPPREPREMPKAFDVIVIGGGISGLSAADDLLNHAKDMGHKTPEVLVPRGSKPAGRAHNDGEDPGWRNGGFGRHVDRPRANPHVQAVPTV